MAAIDRFAAVGCMIATAVCVRVTLLVFLPVVSPWLVRLPG